MAVSSFLDNIFRRKKKKPTDSLASDFISILEFDFDTIRASTDEFSDLIGRGGFSSVYKGRLQNGQEIAVKKLSKSSTRTPREFLTTEVNLLSKLRHKNLIHLLGFCSKRDQHCLVYEFIPNSSSIHHFILDPHRASHLSWEMCQNIVQGIARGLRYIHEESGLSVVHRDINPRNILLDSQMNPKITGFRLARQMKDGENDSKSTVLVGTIGYLDPNYIRTGRVSVKSDVYAFGVTILTIISRRKDTIISGEEYEPLIEYVKRCWNRGEAIDVIHELMREEESEDSISVILRYIHIALLCVDDNPEIRPSLDQVLHWFSCFSTPLPEPTIGIQSTEEAETNRSLYAGHIA